MLIERIYGAEFRYTNDSLMMLFGIQEKYVEFGRKHELVTSHSTHPEHQIFSLPGSLSGFQAFFLF